MCIVYDNHTHYSRAEGYPHENQYRHRRQANGRSNKGHGLTTKKHTVELALKKLVQWKRQENIRAYRGKLDWSGDLDDMREAS